jgi:hypothetical protein
VVKKNRKAIQSIYIYTFRFRPSVVGLVGQRIDDSQTQPSALSVIYYYYVRTQSRQGQRECMVR